VATVMPGYNDLRTGRGNAFVVDREGGAYYERSWQAAIGSAPDWIVINSFNEWPEGTYIEPSQAFGGKFLELTAKWAGVFHSAAPLPSPPPAPVAAPVPTQPARPAIGAPTVPPQKPRPTSSPTPDPVRERQLQERLDRIRD